MGFLQCHWLQPQLVTGFKGENANSIFSVDSPGQQHWICWGREGRNYKTQSVTSRFLLNLSFITPRFTFSRFIKLHTHKNTKAGKDQVQPLTQRLHDHLNTASPNVTTTFLLNTSREVWFPLTQATYCNAWPLFQCRNNFQYPIYIFPSATWGHFPLLCLLSGRCREWQVLPWDFFACLTTRVSLAGP